MANGNQSNSLPPGFKLDMPSGENLPPGFTLDTPAPQWSRNPPIPGLFSGEGTFQGLNAQGQAVPSTIAPGESFTHAIARQILAGIGQAGKGLGQAAINAATGPPGGLPALLSSLNPVSQAGQLVKRAKAGSLSPASSIAALLLGPSALGEGAGAISKMIPSKARAGAALEDISKAAGNMTIDPTEAANVAARTKALAAAGGVMPKVMRDFLTRLSKTDTVSKLKIMSPDQFIDQASSPESKVFSNVVKDYREQIRAGKQLDPLEITRDEDGNLIGADGRHRALAYKQEGIRQVPVIEKAPGPKPITYNEARDLSSNASRLSADEMQRLTPVMRRQAAQFAQALRNATQNVATRAGKGDQFINAMSEYHNAAALNDWLGKWGPIVGKNVIRGAGAGVGGALVYEAMKKR